MKTIRLKQITKAYVTFGPGKKRNDEIDQAFLQTLCFGPLVFGLLILLTYLCLTFDIVFNTIFRLLIFLKKIYKKILILENF